MVRRLLVVYLLVFAAALFWSRAEAATVPARLPANVTYSGGTYNVSGTAAGSAVAAGSTVAVGVGSAVATIPVTYRLGQLAGVALKGALRANAAIAGLQTLDWLLSYGIRKCNDGTWCSQTTPPTSSGPDQAGFQYQDSLGNVVNSFDEACAVMKAAFPMVNPATCDARGVTAVQYSVALLDSTNTVRASRAFTKITNRCQQGYTFTGSTCTFQSQSVPTTDSDWAKVPTTGIPDNVLTGVMIEGKQFLPATPEVATAVQNVPLSSTYKDPTTGASYRDFAYVTPNANDPQSANLQVVKTQVDPATGNPVTDPTTGNTTGTAKPDDPCAANPDRVGCMDKGNIPDAPDLLKSEKTITITPDSGWGADTMACPADLTTALRQGGQMVAFSFKPVCDGADMFRPIVIGLAWFGAVLIALGVGRKGD